MPGPSTLTNINYTQAYLKRQIGRKALIEFLVGTNTFVDRTGTIEDVGVSYIILRDTNTNQEIMADMYSIKFVTFLD
jgi:hypothetical protein